ncbi:MAG: N-acetylmuramoyl-L-alanine amidase [Clostridia bacterium]|nr:N-acetylmuramoyl-L-alanine amidase [Clostridia bacterium]
MRIKSQIISILLLFILLFSTNVSAANRYINLILRYDYTDHKYNAEEVFVSIDDKKLTDLTMPPIILNGYTLVPAREVFEGVGATVEWKKELEQVYIRYNDTLVVIPVDSSKAYINGTPATMQTKAKIINNKTMIPLRFVTTALGFQIEWDKSTRIANIVTRSQTTATTQITTTAAAKITTTTTTTEATTVEPKTEVTTKFAAAATITQNQYDVNNDFYGFDNSTGRFYIKDVNNIININNFIHYDDYYNLNYSLVLNGNYTDLLSSGSFASTAGGISNVNLLVSQDKITITFNETQIMALDITKEGSYVYIKPVLPKEKYSKIIVLDAGHGGNDPGASGNGLIEKDLTLKMLLSAKELFDKSDIKCYVTRSTDMYPSFDDRTNLANEVGDAFISIHINSAANTSASGTETYSLYANDLGNDLTSYRLAEEMLNQLLEKLGTVNRKVKSENWIVLRQSKIPATLIEIGFISNSGDAAIMGSQDGISKVGQAIYEGVVNLFDTYPPVR